MIHWYFFPTHQGIAGNHSRGPVGLRFPFFSRKNEKKKGKLPSASRPARRVWQDSENTSSLQMR